MNFQEIFSKDKINTKRQAAIDLCKTICIILMILCHVFYCIKYTATPTLDAAFIAHNAVRLLGAQFFMFSMGLGIAYSKNDSAKSCLKRGIILLLTGYLLNFLREILPWMVVGTYPMFCNIMVNDKVLMLLSGDILQFAGLAFMFFALMKKLKLNNFVILVITLLLTAIGAFFTNEWSVKLSIDNFYFSFIGLFIPIKNFTASDYVCFSFCNWIIYPVAGWLFGKVIQRCRNLDKFYLYLFWISFPLLLLAWAAFDVAGKNILLVLMNSLNYHQQTPVILAVYMNIILVTICIAHLLSKYLVNFKIWNVVKHLSCELPTLYIVSWIAIGWLGAYLKHNKTFLTKDFDNIFLVFVLVILVSEIYIYFKNRLKTKKTSK